MSILNSDSDSRYIGIADIPEPQSVIAKFVYNFFVSDERTNDKGVAKFQGTKTSQQSIKPGVLSAALPRYVEITFDAVNCGDGNIKDFFDQPVLSDPLCKGMVNSEVTITTMRDAIYRLSDVSVRTRLLEKAQLLSNLYGLGPTDA